MSTFTFTKGDTTEQTVDELISRIMWLTSRLDSTNVKRLDTNETLIKSADGTTYINGPVLEQSDSRGTLRLKQGYDSTSDDFIYALYNEAGTKTVGIDSSGDATFSGAISASSISGGTITGATITGGTLQTSTSGERIVITGDELFVYDSSGDKSGMALDLGDTNYTGFSLYSGGTKRGGLAVDDGNQVVQLYALSGYDLDLSAVAAYGGQVEYNGSEVATQTWVTGEGYITGTSGFSGTFTNGDGDTVTVSNGLITGVA